MRRMRSSDLQWGTADKLTTVLIKPRAQGDGKNTFTTPNNLTPNTKYQFRVRGCDVITCSLWSDWYYVTTGGTSNQVSVFLDNNTTSAIGTATLDSGGHFTLAVQIPPATPSGTHTLIAMASEKTVFVQEPFIIQGSYFTSPGTVTIFDPGGTNIAQAQVQSDGTFQATVTLPLMSPGFYTYKAVETVNGQPPVGHGDDRRTSGPVIEGRLPAPRRAAITPVGSRHTPSATGMSVPPRACGRAVLAAVEIDRQFGAEVFPAFTQ